MSLESKKIIKAQGKKKEKRKDKDKDKKDVWYPGCLAEMDQKIA